MSGFLTDGRADRGEKISVFVKFLDEKEFRDYSIFNFVDRDGCNVSTYGAVKASPIELKDVEVGDCVLVEGRVAKYGSFGGTEVTRLSHLKIMRNMGKPEEKT